MSKYKRVMLKLSGEALSGNKGHGFDEATVIMVGNQVKKMVEQGIEVGIVIGGGNFWRGRSNENMDRCKADEIGMMATVMNCLYASEIFRTLGIKSSVMTPFGVGAMTEEFSRDTALEKIKNQEVVFFAGGTGHPYFSTDTAVALRALQIEAEVILLAKNIDGVYDSDPKKNPEARKYDRISIEEVIQKGLQVVDLTAAIMCQENNMPMLVFYLGDNDSIINAVNDKISGTFVYI